MDMGKQVRNKPKLDFRLVLDFPVCQFHTFHRTLQRYNLVSDPGSQKLVFLQPADPWGLCTALPRNLAHVRY